MPPPRVRTVLAITRVCATLGLLCSSPSGAAHAADAKRVAGQDPLAGLRGALEQAADEASLRRKLQALAPGLGFALGEKPARVGGLSFRLKLRQPVAARRLCEVMGWGRAYAVSGDSHLSAWHIALWSGDLDRWGGPKIATHTPRVGAWAVRPALEGRPQGEPPRLASGGSSAYDLETYPASVTSIDVELWKPGVQGPETIEIPQAATALRLAPSRAVIKAWLESVKGLGAPRYAEAELPDMRVFVAWNIPTSGWNRTDYWIYCLGLVGWKLMKSSSFVPSRDQIHTAEIDAAAREVRFLGAGGKVERRVAIGMCKWSPLQRPQW